MTTPMNPATNSPSQFPTQSSAGADVRPTDPLIEPIALSAHHVVDRAAATASGLVGRARAAASHTGDRLKAKADDIMGIPDEYLEPYRTHVRVHPLRSIVIAASVGWIIGRLL